MPRIAWMVVPLVLANCAAFADASFDFRLSPGPRLVGTRAESSGSGRVHAELKGNVLTLSGDYHGLLAASPAAQLMMGPLPGVRGLKLADLTITPAVNGTISCSIELADMIGSLTSTRSIVFRTAAITGPVSLAVRINKVGLFAEDDGCLAVTK